MSVKFLSGINVDSNTLVVDEVNNRVGIGTTDPKGKFHIAAASGVASLGSTALAIRDAVAPTYGFDFTLEGVASGDLSLVRTELDVQSQVMTFKRSNGNVGIGTTSPAYKLDVDSGSSLSAARFYNSSNVATVVWIGDTGNSDYSDLILQSNSGTGEIFKNGTGYTSYGGALALNIYNSNGAIAFHPNNTANAMFIATAGNVGIGTTSPNTKLRIVESTTNPPLSIQNTNADGYSGSWLYDSAGTLVGHWGWANGTTTALSDKMYFGTIANKPVVITTNDSEKVRITSAGNVGIGTSSPSSKLHVYGGDSFLGLDWASANYDDTPRQFRIASNGNNSGYITQAAYNSSSTALTTFFRSYVNAANSGDLVFESGAGNFNTNSGIPASFSERMRITSAGNVGIGTTSPTRRLHIVSSDDTRGIMVEQTLATSYAEVHLKAAREFRVGTGGSTSDVDARNRFYVYDSTAGAHRFTIDSSGNVGIGTTSPNSEGNLSLGAMSASEGGQLTLFKAAAYDYATHIDNNSNSFRIMYGTDSSSSSVQFIINHSTGNVGIGTTSPSNLLHVAGQPRFDSVGGAPADTSAPVTQDKYYGYNSVVLTDPDTWLKVSISGTDYVIPAYAG